MNLTTAQLQEVKTDILADASLASVPNTQDGSYYIATLYNMASDPAFVVWRDSVHQDEIMQNGFDWVRVDNLSVGKARIWEWLFNNERKTINPSKPNIRLGIDEVWKGTAADLAVRAAVYVHCKRSATRIEALFATGAGTTEDPGVLSFVGPISYDDVHQARNL